MVPINLSYLVSHKGKASSTVLHTCRLWSVEIWWMVTSRIACISCCSHFLIKSHICNFCLQKIVKIYLFFLLHIFVKVTLLKLLCAISNVVSVNNWFNSLTIIFVNIYFNFCMIKVRM